MYPFEVSRMKKVFLSSAASFSICLYSGRQAVDFDNRKIGLHSYNVWDDSAGMPFGGCIVMLCVDIVLYAFLAFYLDNVLPSEYRRPALIVQQRTVWRASYTGVMWRVLCL